mgnify:CR=1 FL=1
MAIQLLTDRYGEQILGVLDCYDRMVFTGTLPQFCYAAGMTSVLNGKGIRIFDYAKVFADPLRDALRKNAEQIAKRHGIEIEFIRRVDAFRKEDRIKNVLEHRGDSPGLVHIFSAMEACMAYRPWHDKQTGKTMLKAADGKCLHYYFYFIDSEYGLCYLRVPTWCPFRLQFYCNGHALLAGRLRKARIPFTLIDNAFFTLGNMTKANALAQDLHIERLHRLLDRYAEFFCPVLKTLEVKPHWSIMQVEYATDIIFRRQADLQRFYSLLVETLIHSVKPENIATFLGQKLHGNYLAEMGNNFTVRQEGTRIKHTMGPVSIKMYDKAKRVLRIETTVNNVTFFRQHRDVHQRDGTIQTKRAPMKKTIYSLAALRDLLRASNHRYLAFLSQIDTPDAGVKAVEKITVSRTEQEHRYKGFNPLHPNDTSLFRVLARGEFCIHGLTSRSLRQYLPDKTSGQISRLLKRLRVHGIIKKIGRSYKYYLTALGQHLVAAVLKLREQFFIPQFSWGCRA